MIRIFSDNRTQYLKKLKHYRISAEEAVNIGKSACTAMNLQVPGNAFPDADTWFIRTGRSISPLRASVPYVPIPL